MKFKLSELLAIYKPEQLKSEQIIETQEIKDKHRFRRQ